MIAPPFSSSPPPSETAVRGLAHLSRHSTVPQLLGLQSSLLTYLEQHSSAPLGSTGATSTGASLAQILTNSAPESHRSPALSWWADRAAESQQPARTVALLGILQKLLVRGTRQRGASDAGSSSLNANGILATLEEMLVQAGLNGTTEPASAAAGRTDANVASGRGPVIHAVLSTIRALVQAVETSGYPNQLDDLASGTIAHLRTLSDLGESAETEVQQSSANAGSTSRDRSWEDTRPARSRLLSVLRLFVDPTSSEASFSPVEGNVQTLRTADNLSNAAPTTSPSPIQDADENATPRLGDDTRPPLLAQETLTSLASAATITLPGMVLGAPVDAGSSFAAPNGGVAAQASEPSPTVDIEGTAAQPVVLVHPPTAKPDTYAFPDVGREASDSAHRKALSPFIMSQSLFLLSDPDPVIRSQYAPILVAYLKQLATQPESAGKPAETEAFWNRFAVSYYDSMVRPSDMGPISASLSDTGALEQRLAETAFANRSVPTLLACAPMLFSLATSEGTTGAAPGHKAAHDCASYALDRLGRTWGIEGLVEKSVSSRQQAVDALVDAIERQSGSQALDSSSIREHLQMPWNHQAAKMTSESLSPRCQGRMPG